MGFHPALRRKLRSVNSEQHGSRFHVTARKATFWRAKPSHKSRKRQNIGALFVQTKPGADETRQKLDARRLNRVLLRILLRNTCFFMAQKFIRSHVLYHLLKVLIPVKKPGLMISEITALIPPEYQQKVGAAVRNALARGVLESAQATADKPRVSYYLSAEALKKYRNLTDWTVAERAGQESKKVSAPPPAPQSESPPNISFEALSLTDQISQVIGQNAQYRNTLAEIHTLIGDLLYPKNTSTPPPVSEE